MNLNGENPKKSKTDKDLLTTFSCDDVAKFTHKNTHTQASVAF